MTVINQTEVSVSAVNSDGGEQYAFPATAGQQLFWYLDRLHPGNPAYNLAIRFQLSGPLQSAILESALAEVVGRHEALRTTFIDQDDKLIQVVSPPRSVPLPTTDLRNQNDPQSRAMR